MAIYDSRETVERSIQPVFRRLEKMLADSEKSLALLSFLH
jgi:hypothetical protein